MQQEVSNERLQAIILCMFWSRYGELLQEVGEGEDPDWVYRLRYSRRTQADHYFPIEHHEFRLLLTSDIIELDTGCDEPGHELYVYQLTEMAYYKTQELIKKRKFAVSLQP